MNNSKILKDFIFLSSFILAVVVYVGMMIKVDYSFPLQFKMKYFSKTKMPFLPLLLDSILTLLFGYCDAVNNLQVTMFFKKLSETIVFSFVDHSNFIARY